MTNGASPNVFIAKPITEDEMDGTYGTGGRKGKFPYKLSCGKPEPKLVTD
jgi:hypothetical protein